MNRLQKIIGVGLFPLALVGCVKETPQQFLEGTVKEEFGTVVDEQKIIERSEGALFGNDSVRFGALTYGLILETEQGEYIIGVKDSRLKPIYVLSRAIEVGDKVRIKYDRSTLIGNDRIGKTYSDTIEVLK